MASIMQPIRTKVNGMKTNLNRRKLLAALATFITVSLFLFTWLPYYQVSPKEEMCTLLQTKADILFNAAVDAKGRYIDNQLADTVNLQAAFQQAGLSSIDARNDEGSANFSFSWTNSGDTSIILLFSPSDSFLEPDSKEWNLTSASTSAWRWDGGAMMSKGYVIVERLKENWFYIEKYYPT